MSLTEYISITNIFIVWNSLKKRFSFLLENKIQWNSGKKLIYIYISWMGIKMKSERQRTSTVEIPLNKCLVIAACHHSGSTFLELLFKWELLIKQVEAALFPLYLASSIGLPWNSCYKLLFLFPIVIFSNGKSRGNVHPLSESLFHVPG